MDENHVEMVLAKLVYIEKSIDEFKERMEKDIRDKCGTCQNAPAFRERFRSQWTHIGAIWVTIGAYFLWIVSKGR